MPGTDVAVASSNGGHGRTVKLGRYANRTSRDEARTAVVICGRERKLKLGAPSKLPLGPASGEVLNRSLRRQCLIRRWTSVYEEFFFRVAHLFVAVAAKVV